ncbi:MAG TPA: hypothetical protein VF541_16855 [Longimicrobium sp.]
MRKHGRAEAPRDRLAGGERAGVPFLRVVGRQDDAAARDGGSPGAPERAYHPYGLLVWDAAAV